VCDALEPFWRLDLPCGHRRARSPHPGTSDLSADTARPGDTVLAGVDMKMEPGWHTY